METAFFMDSSSIFLLQEEIAVAFLRKNNRKSNIESTNKAIGHSPFLAEFKKFLENFIENFRCKITEKIFTLNNNSKIQHLDFT